MCNYVQLYVALISVVETGIAPTLKCKKICDWNTCSGKSVVLRELVANPDSVVLLCCLACSGSIAIGRATYGVSG